MKEVFVVFGKFNVGDYPTLVSAQEHDTYAEAMQEISDTSRMYDYHTIEKLFKVM